MKEVFLTGVKPTGIVHLGNYFGAIKPAVEFSKNKEYSCFYFIADYHALTTVKDAEKLREYTYHVTCAWLAAGVDPKQVVMYKQSDIPEIFELQTILSNITPKGLMNRAHAYKASVDRNKELDQDEDSNINMGLYSYPILMTSDILLFNTKKVPVGLDQKQHVEIARDIAKSFNKNFGKTLVVPKEVINTHIATIKGLDGQKMSKSYNNQIELFLNEQDLRKKIFKIKTDSTPPDEPKDVNNTLVDIYRLFVDSDKLAEFENKLKEGISWADAKQIVFEQVNDTLTPMREKYNYYMNNKDIVDEILKQGATRARQVAKDTLGRVKKSIGAS